MFTHKVDKRSKINMQDYLENHFRYNTMNSWNGLHSFANNVKIHRISKYTQVPDDKLYDFLELEESFKKIHDLIAQWTAEQNYEYTVQFNGRSDGYLVLYKSYREQSRYKSICPHCGQKNYKRAEDNNNGVCGRCHTEGLIPYSGYSLQVHATGVEYDEDCMDSLRETTELVQSFDQLCEDIVQCYFDFCANYDIKEEQYPVMHSRKIVVPVE